MRPVPLIGARPPARRPGRASMVMITASVAASVACSIVMDILLITGSREVPPEIATGTVMFNATVVLMSGVGALIEWRRPGHAVGRLLMLSGPLYAFLGISWLTGGSLEPIMDPSLYRLMNLVSGILSWLGVALIAGWIPLHFPTGTLPGPRWRLPAISLAVAFGVSLTGLAMRMPQSDDPDVWADVAMLVNLTSVAMVALMGLGLAAVVHRYRHGDPVTRLRIRWFGAAVGLCVIGAAGSAVESSIRTDDEPLLMTLVLYLGILAMPVAIGIAVLRYRLYEIDRIISRTIGWAIVTGVLVTVFVVGVMSLQTLLSDVTQGQTLAVATSTLLAFALFQPMRRRVQRAVDRRFDRSGYDSQRTAEAFARAVRREVDLPRLRSMLASTVDEAVRPSATSVWLRHTGGPSR